MWLPQTHRIAKVVIINREIARWRLANVRIQLIKATSGGAISGINSSFITNFHSLQCLVEN